MAGRNAVVALTDQRWYEFLQGLGEGGRLDEVNFWRPLARGAGAGVRGVLAG